VTERLALDSDAAVDFIREIDPHLQSVRSSRLFFLCPSWANSFKEPSPAYGLTGIEPRLRF